MVTPDCKVVGRQLSTSHIKRGRKQTCEHVGMFCDSVTHLPLRGFTVFTVYKHMVT